MATTLSSQMPYSKLFNILFWLFCSTLLWLTSCLADNIKSSEANAVILAPGYGPLAFTAPPPDSYQLPILGKAANGRIIDSKGNKTTLSQLMHGKVVVLSFIYSSCNDVNGCPLATSVLHRVKARLDKENEIADRVRLLTLSFNPEYDTPEVMRQYAKGFQGGSLDWRFLTTKSEQELAPILKSYQQSSQKIYDENGLFTGTFSHILRVFLIDTKSNIRNIYSVSFLHADTLINDIRTLLLEQTNSKLIQITDSKGQQQQENHLEPLYKAGDHKAGYEQSDYQTQSVDLLSRKGSSVDLLQYATQPPLGLPKVPAPTENPLTLDKIKLGRKLFFDRRLSLNNTFSCAMCHVPEQGFSSNEMATAVGIEGRTVRRNSPTLYNIAFAKLLFHDGRENTLEQQVWGPFLAHNEMGNPSVGFVINKIKQSSDYQGLFKKAFGRGPGMETIGMAIASYERTLNSANSAFDRWFYKNNKWALSKSAKQGFDLFTGKAGCNNCHLIGKDHALFMDNKLHNTGVGYQQAMSKEADKLRVQVAPGIFIDVDNDIVATVTERKPNDLGLYEITQNPDDRWKYKTPTLRNIALTAPYMHNGQFSTLKQVIEFYNQGGIANENLDPLIKPLGLSEKEMDDLLAFLKSLTGDNVSKLISDAFAAPVGDVR